jgi:hypothetical protein
MSAAATAAGYLYASGRLGKNDQGNRTTKNKKLHSLGKKK